VGQLFLHKARGGFHAFEIDCERRRKAKGRKKKKGDEAERGGRNLPQPSVPSGKPSSSNRAVLAKVCRRRRKREQQTREIVPAEDANRGRGSFERERFGITWRAEEEVDTERRGPSKSLSSTASKEQAREGEESVNLEGKKGGM